MPRVTVNRQKPKGPYIAVPVSANALDITWTTGDPTNDHQFKPSGNDLLLVRHSGTVTDRNAEILSAEDDKKRKADITTYLISPGEVIAFFIASPGWVQTDGFVYVNVDHADLQIAVLELG